jgi:hypothetical protein
MGRTRIIGGLKVIDLDKPVKCECGLMIKTRDMINHSFKCAAFHNRFGAKIITAKYQKQKTDC